MNTHKHNTFFKTGIMTKNRSLSFFSIILVSILTIVLAFPQNCLGCTMVKITKNGRTIAGNNEDQSNPNTKIWFESGKKGRYGVVYVGFDNLYPQGGMNEAGLVFDGFTQSYKEVKNIIGKKKISALDLEKKIMQECSTAEEVKNLISQYNISFWSSAVLRFVDKTGKCLYVDGDNLTVSQEEYFVQTNVRPYEKKKCWRLEKASRMLEKNVEAGISYCKSIMDTTHQETEWGGTLYSTVYDLDKGIVYLYYFYDYENAIKFELKEELKKGDRVLNIPGLFPGNTYGRKYTTEYNKILSMIKEFGGPLTGDEKGSFKALKDAVCNSFIGRYPFFSKIHSYSQSYLHNDTDCKRAVLLLKLNTELLPNYWKAYSALGDAYMKNKNYKLALENYLHSSKLNPGNASCKKQIEKLKTILEKDTRREK